MGLQVREVREGSREATRRRRGLRKGRAAQSRRQRTKKRSKGIIRFRGREEPNQDTWESARKPDRIGRSVLVETSVMIREG